MFLFFKDFFGIGATIGIGREMLCLLYTGFLQLKFVYSGKMGL